MNEHCYQYPRPAFTVDVIILRWRDGELQTLLIERDREPFKGYLAFPGGFVDAEEAPRVAAVRETFEETHVQVNIDDLIEIGTFATPGRDPRGWTVSVAFVALLNDSQEAQAGDDAAQVAWVPWKALCGGELALAFDHQEIIDQAHKRLSEMILVSPRLLSLLGSRFRIRNARYLYRQLSQREISPRGFKAWLRKTEVLERVGRALYRARDTLKRPW